MITTTPEQMALVFAQDRIRQVLSSLEPFEGPGTPNESDPLACAITLLISAHREMDRALPGGLKADLEGKNALRRLRVRRSGVVKEL